MAALHLADGLLWTACGRRTPSLRLHRSDLSHLFADWAAEFGWLRCVGVSFAGRAAATIAIAGAGRGAAERFGGRTTLALATVRASVGYCLQAIRLGLPDYASRSCDRIC